MARKRKTSTMMEVARLAGVTQPTVSHVFNGRGDAVRISRETQERILDAVRELGYRPNQAARATRIGSFGCVALILSSEEDSRSMLPTGVLAGIDSQLAANKMYLVVAHLPDSKLTSEKFVPRILSQWMADGVIINYNESVPVMLKDLVDRFRLPAVWINDRLPANCVYPDDIGASATLTKWLIAQGRKRIAYAHLAHAAEYLPKAHYSVRDRIAGYEQTMLQAGQSPRLLLPPKGDQADQIHWIKAVMSAPDRPDAVIGYGSDCVNLTGFVAAGLGLTLPSDLLLCTFANGRNSVWVGGVKSPTMLVPEVDVGKSAVTMIVERLAHPKRDCPPIAVPFVSTF